MVTGEPCFSDALSAVPSDEDPPFALLVACEYGSPRPTQEAYMCLSLFFPSHSSGEQGCLERCVKLCCGTCVLSDSESTVFCPRPAPVDAAGLSAQETSRLTANAWKSATQDIRQQYEAMAAEDKLVRALLRLSHLVRIR